jgi:hypothetical protein
MIIVLLCMPWMGLGTEGEARWTNGLYEAICILVCFPLIVAMGAASNDTMRTRTIICTDVERTFWSWGM